MGIDTTSADDISAQSSKMQALKPQASIEYKNSQGKNISFMGEIQAFKKKGKYYRVRLEAFDKLKSNILAGISIFQRVYIIFVFNA